MSPKTRKPPRELGEDAISRFAFTMLSSLDLNMEGVGEGEYKDLIKAIDDTDLLDAITSVYVPPAPKFLNVSGIMELPGISSLLKLRGFSALKKLLEFLDVSQLFELLKNKFGDSLLDEHLIAHTIEEAAIKEAEQGRHWKVKKIENGKARALVFKCGDEMQVFFPPTDPFDLAIWKQDFRVLRPGRYTTTDGQNFKVHKGFLDMTSLVSKKIGEELHNDENCTKIRLSGYSLGGAMAVMCAAVLPKPLREKVQTIYTYGTPPSGDKNFVEYVNHEFQGKIFNIINDRDPVPDSMGIFHHLGFLHPGYERPGRDKNVILGVQRSPVEHMAHQIPLLGFFATLLPGHLPRSYLHGIEKLLREQKAAKVAAEGNGNVSTALDGASAEAAANGKDPGTQAVFP